MKQTKIISEKAFQTRVNRDLKKLMNTWFYKASDRVKNGIPDIIACVDGTFVAIELKRVGGKATPLQIHTLKQIADAYGRACVADPNSWDEIYRDLVQMAGGLKKQGEENGRDEIN